MKLREKMWNEEYYLSFEYDGKRFSSPFGKGFEFRFDVENEIFRLRHKGAKNIIVGVRKWC